MYPIPLTQRTVWEALDNSPHVARDGDFLMKITSIMDLEFPRLKFAIRQGEVKDLPDDSEAAAFILASAYIQEVPEPESKTTRTDT